jgi:hypothetical protein
MAEYSIQYRLEQAKALVEEKVANCEKEAASLKTELQKAKKEVQKAKTQIRNGDAPKNLVALKGKKPFLEMKLDALEKAHAEVLAAKDKLIALYDEDTRDHLRCVAWSPTRSRQVQPPLTPSSCSIAWATT